MAAPSLDSAVPVGPQVGGDGLTSDEAERLLREVGRNELARSAPPTLLRRVLGQLSDPMILLLLGACVVTLFLGDLVDTGVIVAVVVLNSAIGIVQEGKAEQSLAALEALAAPTARVRRDGRFVELDAAEIVPGDVVSLGGGDLVPADLRLTTAHTVQVDESSMTGESVPVDRVPGDELSAGTVVTRGRAEGVVTATGTHSALGRIAELVAASPRLATPLQRRLGELSRTLVIAAGCVSLVVFAVGVAQGRDIGQMLVVGVSLAVAAVPESLPAVVSVALALGAYRMARRAAIVRRLPAVETLGSVTVIATDKTGTLTRNEMVARSGWVPGGFFGLDGLDGLDGTGGTGGPGGPGGLDGTGAAVVPLLEAVALCSDAHLAAESDEALTEGDPLDAALLGLAVACGIDVARIRARHPRVAEVPFDNLVRTMSTTHASAPGTRLVIVKGAPEAVFDLLPEGVDSEAREAADTLARAGSRVLAVAVRSLPAADDSAQDSEFLLLGLVAVADPVRDTARNVVSACHDAGVQVVMVTGDHPTTASSIAHQVGIRPSSALVLDALDDEAVAQAAGETLVFARAKPHQKLALVRSLQQSGQVVAMTGDGVNDAPALRAADIGVAMGQRGTEVARQAAELILADDDLRTVVVAIEEGRRIAANIRTFLRYGLAGGFAEVLVMLVGPLLGMALPLLPAQILWVNMLTHGLPGVAFGGQPANPANMRRPPRSPEESVLGGGLWRDVMTTGALVATVCLVAGLLAPSGEARTHIFLVLGLAQLGVGLALRQPQPGRKLWSDFLVGAIACSAVLQFAAVLVEPLRDLLGTQLPSPGAIAWLCALAVVPGAIVKLAGRFGRLGGPGPSAVGTEQDDSPAQAPRGRTLEVEEPPVAPADHERRRHEHEA